MGPMRSFSVGAAKGVTFVDFLTILAERRIQEAIDEGKLDNLPGKGKPLVLEDNPLIPHEQRVMNSILKQNGVLPGWIQLQRDLQKTQKVLMTAEDSFSWTYNRWRQELAVTASWDVADRARKWYDNERKKFIERVESYAQAVRHYDAVAPKSASRPKPFVAEKEVARFDATYPAY
jgi:hypothetical protein